MSIVTRAKILGFVTPKRIAEFVSEKFNYKVDYSNVRTHSEGPKSNYDFKKEYDSHKEVITGAGAISIELDTTFVTLFYSTKNINTYENLEYYERRGLGDMVRARTTSLFSNYDERISEIIFAIINEFGGWYVENDVKGEYERIIGRQERLKEKSQKKRVDVMVDIETLGDKAVFQIAAVRFDIKTGEILSTFNKIISPENLKNIDGKTLLWWLNTNSELLKSLFAKANCESEEKLFKDFSDWINNFSSKNSTKEDVYLWGNGILFDNRIIKNKCEEYNIVYPIFYRNDRDMRTFVELAAIKCGFASEVEYRKTFAMAGDLHDAFADARFQAMILSSAYKVLIGG